MYFLEHKNEEGFIGNKKNYGSFPFWVQFPFTLQAREKK